jgi:hypothetical protein
VKEVVNNVIIPNIRYKIAPSFSFFQAIIVIMVRMKLGIRCINNAKNQFGSPKTSKAKMLINTINKIDKILGSQ